VTEGKVGYRWGQDLAEQETMDYLEFIARVVAEKPSPSHVFEQVALMAAEERADYF
jgi:hypothetical protein